MSKPVRQPIAVIGSACHFAGDVSSPSKLWDLLEKPQDVRQDIPKSRFSAEGFYHPSHMQSGHNNVLQSYFLNEDVSSFDAEFFGIKPVEAKAIDPQQRLLLETVYEGLESAGLTIQGIRSSNTGVFVGVMNGDYEAMQFRDLEAIPTYFATGTSRSMLSNRISYFFDCRGPSVTIDTACSSSLVAIHLAVQALRNGESHIAIACGSNLILGPESYVVESKLKMLSPDGVCRMWDRDANGYARGDGVATVILKALDAAIADGDHIECVIRETGINQDGSTPGITMPSSEAQKALIRGTYSRAGLNPLQVDGDRPQYFEAHGTGTSTGDPIEAEAISQAFYPAGNSLKTPSPLYVGSIKTVLGHTEGTAGIAGVLKASLALQHGVIPPNLHFHHLNPRVAPFYHKLEIVQNTCKPWPTSSQITQRRRASVNSFGFGGTNAHVILEDYTAHGTAVLEDRTHLFTPFVFSASSENALYKTLEVMASFLECNPKLNPHDLAWTLRERRSLLPHRAYFTAASISDLYTQLIASHQDRNNSKLHLEVGPKRGGHAPKKLVGIFTGQGAQSPRFGAELVEKSLTARNIVLSLEAHLAALPSSDRPSWSLMNELLAESSSSRVHDASIAQPLCIAVQILLVDLLAFAGVKFSAVVGHSSGEIAAAYAAGVLTARDALYIAYFRGLYLDQVSSPNGRHIGGAMIAVETSLADAEELCDDDLFKGRIAVAAINSSSNITISGDEDAIDELQDLFDDEGKLYRRLKTDKAYHSFHMDPCSEPYIQSLRKYSVQVRAPPRDSETPCQWFSSVRCRVINVDEEPGLSDMYWSENMTQPVLFTQALREAIASCTSSDSCAVIEVGPHPALQRPANQVIQETWSDKLPYHGTLARGTDAVTALSNCLGFLWQHSDGLPFSLDNYERAMAAQKQEVGGHNSYELLKGLPSYQWDHTATYWSESRRSRRLRLRPEHYHPLLGHPTPDSSPQHLRWRNLLKATASRGNDLEGGESEMAWIAEHRIQGQAVFPASGFVVTALEATRALPSAISKVAPNQTKNLQLQLVEIHNLNIHQAVTLTTENNDDGVEVLIELADITINGQGTRVRARFTYSTARGNKDDMLNLAASADVSVLLGEDSRNQELLPARASRLPHLIDVDPDRFYASLADLGYNYSGDFRAMTVLKRNHNNASCSIKPKTRAACNPAGSNGKRQNNTNLLIHPTELDVAFQSLLLAFSYPGDDRLHRLHLPLRIECIRVNPAACTHLPDRTDSMNNHEADKESTLIDADAKVLYPSTGKHVSPRTPGFGGDISIFTRASAHAAIQVRNVQLVPIGGAAGEEDDRKMYTATKWVDTTLDGLADPDTDADYVYAKSSTARTARVALERIATFYLRRFDAQVSIDSPLRSTSEGDATAYYLEYARLVGASAEQGGQYDTMEDIQHLTAAHKALPDVRVMELVGETMPRVFRGETTMLEQFRETGVLEKYYADGFTTAPSGRWQANMVARIADRNPRLNFLEIGAGTGGTTKRVLNALGSKFESYTFTDVSAGFFGTAATTFSSYEDRMVFKTLNMEHEPCSQGFVAGAYDVVIASFVLHVSSSLSRTLAHIRKLLRPGGYLVVAEGSVNSMPSNFMFGPLPGWWLGRGDEGRTLSPHVSMAQWDTLLRKAEFSGIDTRAPDEWEEVLAACLFMSQAINDDIRFLRAPLSTENARQSPIKKLVIIGGQSTTMKRLVEQLHGLLSPLVSEIDHAPRLVDIHHDDLDNKATHIAIVSLTELEEPIFDGINEARFLAFKSLFKGGMTMLWVTSGRLVDNPFSNMVVGFGRTAVHETADLLLQHLDIANILGGDVPQIIVEALLRLISRSPEGGCLQDALWTVEPEIIVDSRRHHLVPRLMPIEALNDRYNSGRRVVKRVVDIASDAITIQDHGGFVELEKIYRHHIGENDYPHSIRTKLTYAIPHTYMTPVGRRYLALVEDIDTRNRYLVLIPSLTSIIDIDIKDAFSIPSIGLDDPSLLSQTAAFLSAMSITEPLFTGQTVVVHNAKPDVAYAIAALSSAKGIRAVFVADKDLMQYTTCMLDLQVTSLDPFLSHDDIWSLLQAQKEISCFVSFASAGQSEIRDLILRGLPPWCRRETGEHLHEWPSCADWPTIDGMLSRLLEKAFRHVKEHSDGTHSPPEIINLEEFVENSHHVTATGYDVYKANMAVLNLTASTHQDVRVTRLDTRGAMLKNNRTYWILGMSGALGISLCDWMVSAGARCLVLSSRNPQIDSRWIDSHRNRGVSVNVIPCDITDFADISRAHTTICDMNPPIAGVFNGAMVLRDTSIYNMTFTQLNDVIRPKVIGSLNIDRLFSTHQTPLDFFVLLSSMNCIIGNQGQANYAAANTFQVALAAARRQRGLPGIALNVGALIGAGYIQRTSTRVLDLAVSRGAMMHLSEEDFHQMIAEAIVASRPEARENCGAEITELSVGLLDVMRDAPDRPKWSSDPKFAHLIVHRNKIDRVDALPAASEANINTSAPSAVQDQLRACRTLQEVEKAVRQAFLSLLRFELQIKTMGDEELMATRGHKLGLDSLISVDIRNWLMKTLMVSMPVLRIMSDDTIASLVREAVDQLPPMLTPRISSLTTKDRDAGQQGDTNTKATNSAPGGLTLDTAKSLNNGQRWIDWDLETIPPSADPYIQTGQPPDCIPQTIVLTGSTGLLGHHLLENLLRERPESTKIMCIAIRGLSMPGKRDPMTLLPDNAFLSAQAHRVSFFAGDLTLPRLGLSDADCASIFSTADVVIHVAADTSHMKSYEAIRGANVGSTAELIRLCLPRKIPLHFISSAGVGLFSGNAEPELYPEKAPGTPRVPVEDGNNHMGRGGGPSHGGYTASKWACERLLERTCQEQGLPVWIHRPSTILREGRDARGERANLDWLNGLVHYARVLRAVPEIKNIKGALDMVHVQNVCTQIANAIVRRRQHTSIKNEPRGISYIHEVGDIVVPLDNLERLLILDTGATQEKFLLDPKGSNCRILPMAEWVIKAAEAGLHPAVAALIERMDELGNPNYPLLRKDARK